MTTTDTEARVLDFLHDHPGATAWEVARYLWPESPAWRRRTHMRNGRNGAVGGTMPMKAGVVLGRMWRRGLVVREGIQWYLFR